MKNIGIRLLKEYSFPKTCGLFYEEDGNPTIGTGNFLKVAQNYFILTCKHVADIFFTSRVATAINIDGQKISQKELDYIDKANDVIDFALIKAPNDNSKVKDFYELSDFNLIENFNKYKFQKEDLYLTGMNGELAKKKNDGFMLVPFSYMATPYNDNKESTEDFLYIDYPNSPSEIITTYDKGILPYAGGLSGSFIFKTKGFIKGEFWTASRNSKIIAMQTATSRGKYLKCSNIKHLLEMLENYT